jgi:hypothetical protein
MGWEGRDGKRWMGRREGREEWNRFMIGREGRNGKGRMGWEGRDGMGRKHDLCECTGVNE